jgi:hypothetical protein
MARIPPLRRLVVEDFKDQAKWIEPLLSSINSFFETTTTALNKGLTLGENLAAEIRTVEVDGQFPIKLSWTLAAKPVSVVVGNAYRSDGTTHTHVGPISVQWSFNQAGQLQIDGVFGLLPPTQYFLTADVDFANEEITIPNHQFATGQKVVATSTDTIPSYLSSGSAYYVIRVDENTIQLATSYDNAVAGTAMNLNGSGSGYHILTPGYTKKFKLVLECKTG